MCRSDLISSVAKITTSRMPRKGRKLNPPAEYDSTTSPTATSKRAKKTSPIATPKRAKKTSPNATPKRAKKTKTTTKGPATPTPTTPVIDSSSYHTRHQENEQPCSLEKEIVSKPRKSVCRPLTCEEEEDLVAWLRENTFLYDKSSADFKLKERKNRTWTVKEEELGLKAGDLSSIWYPNMRTQFSKLVKLSSKSGSGVAVHTSRQQWLMDSFSFLRPYLVQLRNQRGSKFAEKRKELIAEDTDDIDAASDMSVSSTATAPGNNPKAAGVYTDVRVRVRAWCNYRCRGFTCTYWTVLGVLDAPNGPAKDEPIRHTFHETCFRPCG